MTTPIQLNEVQQLLESIQQPTVELTKIDCPYTTVVNRAQMVDSPLSSELKIAWASYRQALRDLPNNSSSVEEAIWPTQPE